LSLKPTLIGDEFLVLRAGSLWTVRLRQSNIKEMRSRGGRSPSRREPGYLSLAVINEPQWILELHEPAFAYGVYGRRRMITRLGIATDDPNAFAEVVTRFPGS